HVLGQQRRVVLGLGRHGQGGQPYDDQPSHLHVHLLAHVRAYRRGSSLGYAGVSKDTPERKSMDVTDALTAPGGPSWAIKTPPDTEVTPKPTGGGAEIWW